MKPYLIFVSGQNPPHKIILSDEAAIQEARRLSVKFPEKEVHLLQIVKRFITTGDKTQCLGSHAPEFNNLNINNLVAKSTNKHVRKQLKIVHKKPKILEQING